MSVLIFDRSISTAIVFDNEGKILCSQQFIEESEEKEPVNSFSEMDTLLTDQNGSIFRVNYSTKPYLSQSKGVEMTDNLVSLVACIVNNDQNQYMYRIEIIDQRINQVNKTVDKFERRKQAMKKLQQLDVFNQSLITVPGSKPGKNKSVWSYSNNKSDDKNTRKECQRRKKYMRRDPHWTVCGVNLCFFDLFEDKIRILNLDDIGDAINEIG